MNLLTHIKTVITTRPIVRGMIAYSALWPVGSLIQQTIEGRTIETYDWKRCLRFSLYGGLFVAPTLYGWVRLSSTMWPQTSLRIGMTKALVEQISYGPFALSCFYLGMSTLESKTFSESCDEWKTKFLPTYKVGMCVWPVLQTINFTLVPERNRVLFVSVCSLMWTTFLAYMKQCEKEEVLAQSHHLHIHHKNHQTPSKDRELLS